MNKIYLHITVFFILMIIAIWSLGLTFNWFPPIKTIPPTMHNIVIKRGTSKGDSIYLTNLEKKANIYRDNGHFTKQEKKSRHKILQYYRDNNDTISPKYISNYLDSCFINFDSDHGLTPQMLFYQKQLLKYWKENKLEDKEKRILISSNFYEINRNDILISNQENLLEETLQIQHSIKDINKNDIIIKNTLYITLASLYINNMDNFDKVWEYLHEKVDKTTLKVLPKYFRQIYWLSLSKYYLLNHNIQEAENALNEAKKIVIRRKISAISIKEIEYDICIAKKNDKKTAKVLKHLNTLHLLDGNINFDRILPKIMLKWERNIKKSNKKISYFYCFLIHKTIENTVQTIKEKNTELNEVQKKAINNLLCKCTLLTFKTLQLNEVNIEEKNIEEMYDIIKNNNQSKYIFFQDCIQNILKYPYASKSNILNKCLSDRITEIKNNFQYLTEEEKNIFWNNEYENLQKIYAIDYKYCEYDSIKYNVALLTKGLLLTSTRNLERSIKDSNDTTLIKEYQKLKTIQLNINNKSTKEKTYLQHIADSIEHHLIFNNKHYAKYKNNWDINWHNIQDSLQNNEFAIEYIKYPIYDKKDKIISYQYGALVLSKFNTPQYIDLCSAQKLETIYTEYEINTNKNIDTTLLNLIWNPIEPIVDNDTNTNKPTIYISLDGLLHLINIETLEDINGKLLTEKYNIHRVQSTRIIAQEKINRKITNASLFGGISYNAKQKNNKTKPNNSRNVIIEPGDFSSFFQDLKFAKEEVIYLDSIMQSYNIHTSLKIGEDASEEEFMHLATDNNILHLATHSFWLKTKTFDPLLRCGIALAGVNENLTNLSYSTQNGILSPDEITQVDLHKTELVTLSSCESALGEITPDGVFGLQRAFIQAGAQSILMSLWKIDDKKTKEFMILFYTHWLEGHSKKEALNFAQQKFRDLNYDKKHWSAFILLE